MAAPERTDARTPEGRRHVAFAPPRRPPRLMRFVFLCTSAIVVGLVAGVVEGAIYPPGGPRIPLFAYWTLLAVLLFLGLYALAQAIEAHRARAFVHSVALLPLCVVAQDAASLVLQGSSPATATWYAEVFGHNLLTRNDGIAPGFYAVFAATSLVLLFATVWGPPLARRATHRFGRVGI